jgi:hypothetical protein
MRVLRATPVVVVKAREKRYRSTSKHAAKLA